jgi:hypothetical protein
VRVVEHTSTHRFEAIIATNLLIKALSIPITYTQQRLAPKMQVRGALGLRAVGLLPPCSTGLTTEHGQSSNSRTPHLSRAVTC